MDSVVYAFNILDCVVSIGSEPSMILQKNLADSFARFFVIAMRMSISRLEERGKEYAACAGRREPHR